ncbi:MAG: GntR family transcriptional regulator [Spirochaetales bacterium]|nr:GntR family transcriptional regulator [Spirochaetales bacterium]
MKIGETNTLNVLRKSGPYYILCDKDGNTIELHQNELRIPCPVGQKLEVFVASRKQACYGNPKAVIGDFAALTVKSVQQFGVFLDWGISKDLFVPKRNLTGKPRQGDTLVVYIMPDFENDGVIGTMYLQEFFRMDVDNLETGSKLPLLVYEQTPLGFNVVIDNRYSGLVYKNEVFRDLKTGDTLEGYIRKIREDGGIDISLQPIGFMAANTDAEQVILDYLTANGGSMQLHDKSSPAEIQAALQLSKKAFKRATGTLYKAGTITLHEDGISLV